MANFLAHGCFPCSPLFEGCCCVIPLILLSFQQKLESSEINDPVWIPAFAGMINILDIYATTPFQRDISIFIVKNTYRELTLTEVNGVAPLAISIMGGSELTATLEGTSLV